MMEEPQTELEVYVPGTDPEIDDMMALLHDSLDERIEATTSKRDEMQELIDRMTAIQLEHEYDVMQLAQKLDESLPTGAEFVMKEIRPLISFPVSQQYRDNKTLEELESFDLSSLAGNESNDINGNNYDSESVLGMHVDQFESPIVYVTAGDSADMAAQPEPEPEPELPDIGTKRRRVSAVKPKSDDFITDADVATYQALQMEYWIKPDKLLILNVQAKMWSIIKAATDSAEKPNCLICEKPFSAPQSNFRYHLETCHPHLFNCIAVNMFTLDKSEQLCVMCLDNSVGR